MDAYQFHIENLIYELSCQKLVLTYCCTEIQQAIRRNENYSLTKKEIEKAKIILQAQNDIDTVNLDEVDDLLSKAQQLILTKDCNQSSKSSKVRQKSTSALKKKTIHSKGPATVKRIGKSADCKSRVRQADIAKSEIKISEMEPSNLNAQNKESRVTPKKLPEPYREEFLTLLNDCKKCNKFVKRNSIKHKADTDKEKLAFLGAVSNIEQDRKPCYIEKNEYVDRIIEQFDYQSDLLLESSNLKETLLDLIEFHKESHRLEFLLTHSKVFRQYLLENQVDSKTYRLIYWYLTKSLPVLIVDDG